MVLGGLAGALGGLSGVSGLSLLGAGQSHALSSDALVFPRDHGSHIESQTEWWYATGELQSGADRFGFQVTFFRSRVGVTQALTSAFAAKQLVFAHAAVTDLQRKTLRHDDRIARWDGVWPSGPGSLQPVVGASPRDTQVVLRDWQLSRNASTQGYSAQVRAKGFVFDLNLAPTQPLLLQGVAGLSRKGPDISQVSRYYSLPQLRATGQLSLSTGEGARIDKPISVQGTAWLDHEWSDEILHPEAVGWDWIGMNLFDGSSLTAFQLRRTDGSPLWSGGSLRGATTAPRIAENGEITFTASTDPAKRFKSKKTGADYPIEWQVRTPTGTFTVRAMLTDQELDGRSSTGTVYWEGLSELINATGQVVGRGYLEMTGYAGRVRL